MGNGQGVQDGVTRVYSERLWGLYASLDQSLDPRGPDMLHEMACTYLTADSLILDAGCRRRASDPARAGDGCARRGRRSG